MFDTLSIRSEVIGKSIYVNVADLALHFYSAAAEMDKVLADMGGADPADTAYIRGIQDATQSITSFLAEAGLVGLSKV